MDFHVVQFCSLSGEWWKLSRHIWQIVKKKEIEPTLRIADFVSWDFLDMSGTLKEQTPMSWLPPCACAASLFVVQGWQWYVESHSAAHAFAQISPH